MIFKLFVVASRACETSDTSWKCWIYIRNRFQVRKTCPVPVNLERSCHQALMGVKFYTYEASEVCYSLPPSLNVSYYAWSLYSVRMSNPILSQWVVHLLNIGRYQRHFYENSTCNWCSLILVNGEHKMHIFLDGQRGWPFYKARVDANALHNRFEILMDSDVCFPSEG